MELVVRKFLEDNPKLLELGAAGLVASALARAYPCKQEVDKEEAKGQSR